MKNRETAQQWWTTLCGWMEQFRGKADCLFVYDRQRDRLARCFDRNVSLPDVDADTVDGLYRAASEGCFGLLRPDDGKPQLLTTDLSDLLTSGCEPDARDMERLEWDRKKRERKKHEEYLEAQNLSAWAAAYVRQERERLEDWMEAYDQMDAWLQEQARWLREWREQLAQITEERLEDMSRELHDMDVAGADEVVRNEKIRSYLDGARSDKPTEKSIPDRQPEGLGPISGEMWGSTLRCFCRFAASEVPLSVRHMKVAEYCRRIVQQAKKQGVGLEAMGLDPQEQSVVRGTIEMGTLVERGLRAQVALSGGRNLDAGQYRDCLQDFLAMKGIEVVMDLHVKAHQESIGAGEGPASSVQVLMAHRGFHAKELREKAGRTKTLALAERIEPQKMAQMIRRNSGELSAMGRQVMMDSYRTADVHQNGPQSVCEPGAPQKGGTKH